MIWNRKQKQVWSKKNLQQNSTASLQHVKLCCKWWSRIRPINSNDYRIYTYHCNLNYVRSRSLKEDINKWTKQYHIILQHPKTTQKRRYQINDNQKKNRLYLTNRVYCLSLSLCFFFTVSKFYFWQEPFSSLQGYHISIIQTNMCN